MKVPERRDNPYAFLDWLWLPGSKIQLELCEEVAAPTVEVTGNPSGMVSVANALLWLSSFAQGYEDLELSALPFVADGPISLEVRMPLGVDKGEMGQLLQHEESAFEWHTDEDRLQIMACAIHSIGCAPERDYVEAYLAPGSCARLVFRLNEASTL